MLGKVIKVGDEVHFFHNSEEENRMGKINLQSMDGYLGVKDNATCLAQKIEKLPLAWDLELKQNSYERLIEIFKPSIIRTDKREEEVRKEGKMKGHDRWWKKPKGPDLRLEDISPFMHRWVCRFMIQSSAGAGSPVYYGNTIRLKHLGSSRYLSITKPQNNPRLKLSLQESPSCNFKILPKYKIGAEGETIFYDDTVTLFNTFHSLYINYQVNRGEIIAEGELFLSNKSLGWEIKEFNKLGEDKAIAEDIGEGAAPIRAGDTCRLFYREIIGFLTGRINDTKCQYKGSQEGGKFDRKQSAEESLNQIFENFLPSTEDINESHKKYNLYIQALRTKRKNKKIMDTNSIFMFENVNPMEGSFVRWGQKVRLLHLASGLWLQIKDNKPVLGKVKDQSSLFIFQPISSKTKSEVVRYNSSAKLLNVESSLYIGCNSSLSFNDQEIKRLVKQKEECEKVPDSIFKDYETDAEDVDFLYSAMPRHHVVAHENNGQGVDEIHRHYLRIYKKFHIKENEVNSIEKSADCDLFSIQHVSENTIAELQIISGHKRLLLIYLTEINKSLKRSDRINEGLLEGLEYTLKSLIINITTRKAEHFLISLEGLQEAVSYERPSKLKQKIMIGEYLINIVSKIITDFWAYKLEEHYAEKEEVERLESPGLEYMKMESICKHAHFLLKLIVRDNKRAALIIKELGLMELLIQQLVTPWDLCINDLLDIPKLYEQHHMKILNIKEIDKLIEKLRIYTNKGIYKPKILTLLADICIQGGKSNKHLQNIIIERIIGKFANHSNTVHDIGYIIYYVYIYIYIDGLCWDIWRSSYIFYIQERENEGYNIYLNLKPNKSIYSSYFNNRDVLTEEGEEINFEETNFEDLENFLCEKILYRDKIEYFKAEIRLFICLAQDYNKKCQEILSKLFPPKLLIYCLNSRRIGKALKILIMELLDNLYIKYYQLGKTPTTLIPKVLLWSPYEEGKKCGEYNEEIIHEENKLFSLNYFCRGFSSYEDYEDMESIEITMNADIDINLSSMGGFSEVSEVGHESHGITLNNAKYVGNKIITHSLHPIKKSTIYADTDQCKKAIVDYIFSIPKIKKLTQQTFLEKKMNYCENIYHSRIGLYNFVLSTLNESLTWSLKPKKLQFFVSFYKMLNSLMLTKFFDKCYNKNLLEILGKKPDETLDTEENFFSNLRMQLIKKLQHVRVQYFDIEKEEEKKRRPPKESQELRKQHKEKEGKRISLGVISNWRKVQKVASIEGVIRTIERKEDKISREEMTKRIEESDPTGKAMAKVKFQICRSFQIINSMYHRSTLMGLWGTYCDIMHKWLTKNRVLTNREGGNEISKNLIITVVQAKRLLRKFSLKEIQRRSSRKSLTNGDQIINKDVLRNINNLNKGETVEELNVDINEYRYKPLTTEQWDQASKPISDFINYYFEESSPGHYFTHKTGSDTEENELLGILSDMIYNKNEKLNIIALDLIYQQFNHFKYLLSKLENNLILFGEKELETYKYIIKIKKIFKILGGSAKLTKNKIVLQEIIELFKAPNNQLSKPGLIELCYSQIWGCKCEECNRWFSSYNPDLRNITDMNDDESKHLAINCPCTFTKHKYRTSSLILRNQELLRITKVHIIIYKFLKRNIPDNCFGQKQITVLENCFEFLYYFIKNNECNRKELTNKKWTRTLLRCYKFRRFTKKAVRKFILRTIVLNVPIQDLIYMDSNETNDLSQLIGKMHRGIFIQRNQHTDADFMPFDYSSFPEFHEINENNSILYRHLEFMDLLSLWIMQNCMNTHGSHIECISNERILDAIFNLNIPLYIRLPYQRLLLGMSPAEFGHQLFIHKNKKESKGIFREWTVIMSKFLEIYKEKRVSEPKYENLLIDNNELFKYRFFNYGVLNSILPTITYLFNKWKKQIKNLIKSDEGHLEETIMGMNYEGDEYFISIFDLLVREIYEMGSNKKLNSNRKRREIILLALESLQQIYEEYIEASNCSNRHLPSQEEIDEVVEKLTKFQLKEKVEEIEFRNEKIETEFIQKTCLPILLDQTSRAVIDQHGVNKEGDNNIENEKNQIHILTENIDIDELFLPEFYYFVAYFRLNLLKYEGAPEAGEQKYGAIYYSQTETTPRHILNKYQCKINFQAKRGETLIYDGKKYRMHQDFNKLYANEGSGIFRNILKNIQNLRSGSNIQTDIGFLKMMQAILILQGAKFLEEDEDKFIFKTNYEDDKPQKLEIVQQLFCEQQLDIKTDQFIMVMISSAYDLLEKNKRQFNSILLETIKLGITCVSFGNIEVQEIFKNSYKNAINNREMGQYFLLGMKKIITLGGRSYYSNGGNVLVEKILLFTCIFIRNLCEGQNKTMKNFFREQQVLKFNIDIVSELSNICTSIAAQLWIDIKGIVEGCRSMNLILKETDLKFMNQLLDTLSELCQGPCFANQSTLLRSTKLTHNLAWLLLYISKGFSTKKLFENEINEKENNKKDFTELTIQLLETEKSILVLFKALVEGRNSEMMRSESKHYHEMKLLQGALQISSIFENFLTCRIQIIFPENEKASWEEIRGRFDSINFFHYYSFFSIHMEIYGVAEKKEEGRISQNEFFELKEKLETKFELKSMDDVMGRCEIINSENNIEIIHYPMPINVMKYWNTTIIQTKAKDLLETVKRDTPEEKVKDYLLKSKELKEAIQHRAKIRWYTKRLPRRFGSFIDWTLTVKVLWLAIGILLVLLLNFILLRTFKTELECPEEYILKTDECLEGKGETVIVTDLEFEILFNIFGPMTILALFILTFIHFVNYTLLNIFNALHEIKDKQTDLKNSLWLYFNRYWGVAKCLIFDQSFWFYLAMMIFTILGLYYWKAYLAVTMLLVLFENKLSKYILTSVLDHWDTFLITLVVGFICFYWFSVVTFFSSWRGDYALEDQMACETLWNCFRIHMDYGFMAFPVWNEAPLPLKAASFNFIWVLVCNLCLTAIISGIIIDSFGEKRAAREALQQDTEEFCFVCNIDRDEFEKCGIDFQNHIMHHHYVWQYLWLIIYLEDKNRDQYNGIEEYIWNLYQKDSIDYFPIKQCIQLQNAESIKKIDLRHLFELVENGFQNLAERIDKKES